MGKRGQAGGKSGEMGGRGGCGIINRSGWEMRDPLPEWEKWGEWGGGGWEDMPIVHSPISLIFPEATDPPLSSLCKRECPGIRRKKGGKCEASIGVLRTGYPRGTRGPLASGTSSAREGPGGRTHAVRRSPPAASQVQSTKKYAFKCHRSPNNQIVYPVNALAFHPRSSGGSRAPWRRARLGGPVGVSAARAGPTTCVGAPQIQGFGHAPHAKRVRGLSRVHPSVGCVRVSHPICYQRGGGIQQRSSGSQLLCEIVVRSLFGVFKVFFLHGYMLGCALPTCAMPKDLVVDNWFPTAVAEVLKWWFLICSAPAAFDGVQTRALVDAPGKSSGK